MASPDTTQVKALLQGVAYVAPAGSTLPTAAGATVDAAFVACGDMTADGFTESNNETMNTIYNQAGQPVRVLTTQFDETVAVTFLQENQTTLTLYYKGSTVTSAGSGLGSKLSVSFPNRDRRAFVFDAIDGSTHYRLVIPNGEVTTRGDRVSNNQGVRTLPVTITAYPDTSGNSTYRYSDLASWATP